MLATLKRGEGTWGQWRVAVSGQPSRGPVGLH